MPGRPVPGCGRPPRTRQGGKQTRRPAPRPLSLLRGEVPAEFRSFSLAEGHTQAVRQVEEGSTATDYIKTTSTISGAARYEDGELILEEARTNLLSYSEAFNADTTVISGSIITNAAVAPDGSTTADLLTGSDPHFYKTLTTSNTKTYAVSTYVKAAGHTTGELRIGLSGNYVEVQFDLSAETYTIVDAGTATAISGGIQSAGNGWYRVHVVGSAVGTSTSNIAFYGNLYWWGAQLEEGSFITSYIPTTTFASVTRAADVSTSALGVDTFYNQTEGTVFAVADTPTLTNIVVASISDGTNDNKIEVRSSATDLTKSRAVIRASGTNTFDKSPTASTGRFRNLALAYKATDSKFATSQFLSSIDTSVTIPSVNRLYLGNEFNDTERRPGHIKRLSYFPTRLPDATLQSITT